MKIFHFSLFTFLFLIITTVTAQPPTTYYNTTDGKSGEALKSALKAVIENHKHITYGNLWASYEKIDYLDNTNASGRHQVFDMYSNTVRYFAGNGRSVSGMNREHTVPKSWWGSEENNAYSDLFNVIPADADANSAKSNFSLGTVTGQQTFSNGRIKVGRGSRGWSVFEPSDEYKGDFARIYFYMATCYPDIEWIDNDYCAMTKEDYPTLKPWITSLLLRWNEEDPVSEWEMTRQERTYRVQNNRNPFIDYPDLANYIWGDKSTTGFDLGAAQLHVIDVPEMESDTIFASSLKSDEAGFTVNNVVLPSNINGVWKNDPDYGWKASAYVNNTNYATESWLISPGITLPAVKSYLSFKHAMKFGNKSQLSVHISMDKSNWTELNVTAWPSGANWTPVSSGHISLAGWAGETVYIAYRYTSTATQAATWEIMDFAVVKDLVNDDIVPVGTKGTGQEEDPYTVGDVLALFEADQVPEGNRWVKGYAAGYVPVGATTVAAAVFEQAPDLPEGQRYTNLLLGENADGTSPDNCVGVQLPAGDIRNSLQMSLDYIYQHEISVFGTLERYLAIPGVKNTSDAKYEKPDEPEPDAISKPVLTDGVADADPSMVFDLAGRRQQSKVLRPGLYIVNKKKLWIK